MSSYIPICVSLVASAVQGPIFPDFLILYVDIWQDAFGGNWCVAKSLPTQQNTSIKCGYTNMSLLRVDYWARGRRLGHTCLRTDDHCDRHSKLLT